ncbi:unnamed protein product, partial [Cuscuta epithymum]
MTYIYLKYSGEGVAPAPARPPLVLPLRLLEDGLDAISCSHVHVVCHFLNRPVDQLIPEEYKLSSYINAHAGEIMPLPNMNEWPDIGIHLLPPKYLSQTSRVGRRQETRFQN